MFLPRRMQCAAVGNHKSTSNYLTNAQMNAAKDFEKIDKVNWRQKKFSATWKRVFKRTSTGETQKEKKKVLQWLIIGTNTDDVCQVLCFYSAFHVRPVTRNTGCQTDNNPLGHPKILSF
jgi:hypothetical protein